MSRVNSIFIIDIFRFFMEEVDSNGKSFRSFIDIAEVSFGTLFAPPVEGLDFHWGGFSCWFS